MRVISLSILLMFTATSFAQTRTGKQIKADSLSATEVMLLRSSLNDTTKTDKATICPVCHKEDMVVPIRYGKPARELMKQAEEGKVKLGGCMVSATSPKHYCKRDKHSF